MYWNFKYKINFSIVLTSRLGCEWFRPNYLYKHVKKNLKTKDIEFHFYTCKNVDCNEETTGLCNEEHATDVETFIDGMLKLQGGTEENTIISIHRRRRTARPVRVVDLSSFRLTYQMTAENRGKNMTILQIFKGGKKIERCWNLRLDKSTGQTLEFRHSR